MRKIVGLVLILALLVPVASLLAQEEGMVEPIELPEVDPLSITGDIITAGSSTVFPLTSVVAEEFEADGYTGTITIDSIGTGAGFERFCSSAESDISNASRAIQEDEIEECEANGRTPVEFYVGIDALAIAVNPENDFAENLTILELGAIFAGEAQTWADINPDWPAEPIAIFQPGTDSGTFDFFVETVMEPYAEEQGVAEDEVGDAATEFILGVEGAQFSENDNILVEGVTGNPYAIGYFGYAYFAENPEAIRLLTIEGIEANAETAESGEYPLSRPLFIYSTADIMAEKPQVASFINYYLTNVLEFVTEAGYFPTSIEANNEAKMNWLAAMGMEAE